MKQLLVVLNLLLLSQIGITQTDNLPDPEAFFSAIIINNLDTSITWYVEKLGFTLSNKVDQRERGFRQANLVRGNLELELIEFQNAITNNDIRTKFGSKARLQGFFKFGLRINQFDKWINHLEKNKASFHGKIVRDPISNKKMVILKDPDGNRIQLFEN